MRISYVNGEFLPHEKAVIPIEDRGFQFADAVYEVVPFFNRTLFDLEPHYTRLQRSLDGLFIKNPLTLSDMTGIFEGLVEKNTISEGIIYLQITRGEAMRDHAFPVPAPRPNVVATAKALPMDSIKERLQKGVGIILVLENRWRQVDIKSTSLLGNVLAKQKAAEAGCYEAVFVDPDSNITEGTSSNAWMVDKEGILRTRKASGVILDGITRKSVVTGLGGDFQLAEEPFSKADALNAAEFFLTSTTSLVMPITTIDGKPVGNGMVGPVTRAMQKIYYDRILKETGYSVA